jgi:hypothetical protein
LDRPAQDSHAIDGASDCSGEFGECDLDAPVVAGVKPEFVVAAAKVLHQRVAAHNHSRGTVAFESAHRTEPGFEPAVVALDAVVRVLLGVVKDGGHARIDRRP